MNRIKIYQICVHFEKDRIKKIDSKNTTFKSQLSFNLNFYYDFATLQSFTSHFTLNLDYIREVFNLLIVKKKGFEFKDMQDFRLSLSDL